MDDVDLRCWGSKSWKWHQRWILAKKLQVVLHITRCFEGRVLKMYIGMCTCHVCGDWRGDCISFSWKKWRLFLEAHTISPGVKWGRTATSKMVHPHLGLHIYPQCPPTSHPYLHGKMDKLTLNIPQYKVTSWLLETHLSGLSKSTRNHNGHLFHQFPTTTNHQA